MVVEKQVLHVELVGMSLVLHLLVVLLKNKQNVVIQMKPDLYSSENMLEFKRFQMIGNLQVLLHNNKQIGNAVPCKFRKRSWLFYIEIFKSILQFVKT